MLQYHPNAVRSSSPNIPIDKVPKSQLAEAYDRYFKVEVANTPMQRNDAYRLRYQVYCVENPFEDPAEHAGGLETDEFDSRSEHALLIHRQTHCVAGAVRLVFPDLANPTKSLPIHGICNHPLLSDPVRLPPAQSAEISRFTIAKQFRQSRGDGRYPGIRLGETRRSGQDRRQATAPTAGEGLPQSDDKRSAPDRRSGIDRRVIPYMTLGLLNGLLRIGTKNNITHVCAVMEPALLRLLARMGIYFEPLGPLVEYHGRRRPVYAEVDKLFARNWEERPEVWEVITDQGALWSPPERAVEAE